MSDEVIAERTFQLEGGGSIHVRWMKPVPDGQDWSCAYEISRPDKPVRRRRAMGVDSAQALVLALESVGNDVYHMKTVFWWDPNDDLGLPVSRGLEDLREGRGA